MKNIVTENPEFSIINMAKINATNLSSIVDSEELVDFIAVNRYEPENSDLLQTNDFTSFILKFDSYQEMLNLTEHLINEQAEQAWWIT